MRDLDLQISYLDLQISYLDLQISSYCEDTTHKVSISPNLDLQIFRFGSADFAIWICRFPDLDLQISRFGFADFLFGFADFRFGFADCRLGFAEIGVSQNPRLQNPGFLSPEVVC